MKKIFSFLFVLISFTVSAQSLYVPNNPDSLTLPMQISHVWRYVYIKDLLKNVNTSLAAKQPLEDQRVSSTNAPSFAGLTATAPITLAGSSTPATPASGRQLLYINTGGYFTVMGSNGFGLSISKSRLTASRLITFQDKDYTAADSADAAANATAITATNTRTALNLGAMTRTARDALSSPVAGSTIYNTTDGYPEFYDSFWGWMPYYASNEWRKHYGIEYFRDFYLNTNDAFIGTNNANSGGINNSGAPTGATSEAGGTVSLLMQTTTNSRAGWTTGTGVVILGSGVTVYETRVQLSALSNSTDRYQFLAGLVDNPNGIDQVDGVYFLYDEGGASTGSTASANWELVTSSNSTRTFTVSSSAVAASTWYTLREEVNAAGTQANFYVNGTLINPSGPITTNIPTGLTRATGIGIMAQKSLGTTTRTVLLNYLSYKQKFTNPR